MKSPPVQASSAGSPSWREVFLAFLRLGCTSFGGPIAHLAWFRREFVERRGWLDAQAFADLVALCQILPGPASSQVGLAIGLMRAGLPGAAAAWLGFTLPSALLMLALGSWLSALFPAGPAVLAVLHGLKLVAVPVVGQAILSMGRTLCPDPPRLAVAMMAALICANIPGIGAQIVVCAGGAGFGHALLRPAALLPQSPFRTGLSARLGKRLLLAFGVLLAALPLASRLSGVPGVALFDAFYRAGALVFGGGHVVLPVLQAEVVAQGWVSPAQFLAGYGAAQALPGPLFTFAAYLGAVSSQPPGGGLGGVLALLAIFLPGALLVTGCLPLWESARRHPGARAALMGLNAVVVGLLLAAFCSLVWPGAVHGMGDVLLAGVGLLMLLASLPMWSLVLLEIAGTLALGL